MSDVWVKFEKRAVHMTFKSEQEGRPIYEDRDFVSIRNPGSMDNVVREAREADKEKYATQWARYVANQEQVQDGTPIEEWPALTASQREELKYLKVCTVEAIAGLSDAQAQRLGAGYMSLREKAKAYLDNAKDSAAAQRLAADNEALRNELKDLRDVVAQLQAQVDRKGRKEAA